MRRTSSQPIALLILIVTSACTPVDKVGTISTTPILQMLVVADSDSIPADGATLTKVSVQAMSAADAPSAPGTVTFSTTSGGWLPARQDSGGAPSATITVGVDTTSTATAYLQSPLQTGPGIVSAGAGQTILQSGVVFVLAPPNTIGLAASRLVLHDNSGDSLQTLTITGLLTRQPGRVTPGYVVTFTDSDATGHSHGVFDTATPSDTLGAFSVHYADTSATFAGPVTLSGKIGIAVGDTIRRSITIAIEAP